jgi:glycosyltransferase involved in cell wall biosynthesis
MISFIIPSYNNLKHLKNVYTSIKKHEPEAEIILLDDGSTDGTWEWIQKQDVIKYRSENRIGHTILYDKGIELATNEIVGILHADMIVGPNYSKNMLKHLKPGKVICATRIEPPLHPEGKEKIIKDFGMDFDTLNIDMFEEYVTIAAEHEKDKTTKGMFAPWILCKEDFQAIGGHDPLFAPFPYEDSDIFQRWILAGYELIQSRDAFVYHLTCRGHRWNEQVGKDDDYYKTVSQRAARNYLRKWGSWIKNDEYQYPIILPKYDIAFVVHNCNLQILEALEPWCGRIYTNETYRIGRMWDYVEMEQSNTSFDLSKRVLTIEHNNPITENNIVIEFDGTKLTNENFQLLQRLPEIIQDSGEVGEFELDIFKLTINNLTTYEHTLIKV